VRWIHRCATVGLACVSAPNALCMSYACVMDWHGYRNADSMSRQRYSTEGPPSHLSRSEPAAPVFDAVMVGCESVADAPQNRLSAAGDVDLAIDRSDVELHRVRTRCVSGATSALLRPWVISAKISDSRSVNPSLRPDQFSRPMLRARRVAR
jgi:hypothetical protein